MGGAREGLENLGSQIETGGVALANTFMQFMSNAETEGRWDEARDLQSDMSGRIMGGYADPYNAIPYRPGVNTLRGETLGAMNADQAMARTERANLGVWQDAGRRREVEGAEQSWQRRGQGLIDYAQGRLTTGMDYLKGAGDQERRDIRQDYTNIGNEQAADASARGLSGTSIMPSMRRGVAREQTAALSRLDERLQNQYLDTYTGLSGDVLNTQGAVSSYAQGLQESGGRYIQGGREGTANFNYDQTQAERGQYAAQDLSLKQNQWAWDERMTGGAINLLASRENVYTPTPLAAYEQAGTSRQPAYEAPEVDNTGQMVSTGINTGLAGLTTYAAFAN